MELADILREVEGKVNAEGVGFHFKRATLYGISEPLPNGLGYEIEKELEHGDIYDLLESDRASEVAQQYPYVAIMTAGWATPLPDGKDVPDIAPSMSPDKKRIRLMVIGARGTTEFVSAIRFSDNPDKLIIDEGHAQGAMADALIQLMSDKKAKPEMPDFLRKFLTGAEEHYRKQGSDDE